MKAKLITWLGLGLSLALLVWIASKIDVGQTVKVIAQADPLWFAAATLAYVALFPLRGFRWAVLLAPVKKVSTRTASEVFLVGFMANNLLPARLGDVVRAFVLAKKEEVAASATFSNVMLERIFDGLSVVAILAISLFFAAPGAGYVQSLGIVMALAFLGAMSLCVLLAHNEDRTISLMCKVAFFLPQEILEKLVAIAKKLSFGLHTLRSLRQSMIVMALSALVWALEVLVYVLLAQALGIELSAMALALVMAILTLGLTAPSAPGFVGVFEGLVVSALGLYAIEATPAAAFAIALHLIHYVPGTLLGLGFAWGQGLHLKQLSRTKMESAAENTPVARAA